MFWLLKGFFYLTGGVITLTTGLASYLAFLQPDFYFPQPTGKYAVGTTTRHVVDAHRKMPVHDQFENSSKELMVQVWYPSSLDKMAQKPTAPYAPDVIHYYKRNQKMGWLLTMSRSMYTFAAQDAPLINGAEQLPVIIFSHGFAGTRNSNTVHCEELASHGYVVVGIDHSYGCSVVQFPDGRITEIDQAKLQKNFVENPMESFEKHNSNVDIWVDDVQMVLDHLEQTNHNAASPFHNRLNMNSVGMFGHSYGGAATVQVCRRDKRVKAGVNMDGALFGTKALEPFDKPFMFLCGQPISQKEVQELILKAGLKKDAIEYANALYESYMPSIDGFVKALKHDVYKVTVRDTGHMAFCDMAIIKEACLLAKPLQNLGAGKLNGYKSTEIINSYLLGFFDKYLKGVSSPLLDSEKSKYPEVEFVAKR